MTDVPERSGDVIILGLILSLFAFMLLVAYTFKVYLQGDDWHTLVFPLVRLSHSAFMGLGILVSIGAYRRGRTGWWMYLLLAVVPVVQLVVPILWFTRTRRREARVARWTV